MPLKTLSAIFFKGEQRKGRNITVHGCKQASRIPGRYTRGREDQHVGVHTSTGLPWYPGHCAFSEDRRTKHLRGPSAADDANGGDARVGAFGPLKKHAFCWI